MSGRLQTRFPGHGDGANSGITHPRALAYGYEFSGAPHSTLRLFLVHLHMVAVALGVPAFMHSSGLDPLP